MSVITICVSAFHGDLMGYLAFILAPVDLVISLIYPISPLSLVYSTLSHYFLAFTKILPRAS